MQVNARTIAYEGVNLEIITYYITMLKLLNIVTNYVPHNIAQGHSVGNPKSHAWQLVPLNWHKLAYRKQTTQWPAYVVTKNYEHWESEAGMKIVGNTHKRRKKGKHVTSEDYHLHVNTSDIIDSYKT